MPSFQTKALVVTPIVAIILDLSHPIVWLVRHVCSDKAEFSFLQKKRGVLMLFQTCTKLTFGQSDLFVVTVVARNRINGVGSLFFVTGSLGLAKKCPKF